jgi:hypothetical protein
MYRFSIFDLGTSWRWLVSFTSRLLYPRGKSPWYPLDRRLGGSQPVWTTWRGENIWPLPGLEVRPLGCSARSQSLYRLRYPGLYFAGSTANLKAKSVKSGGVKFIRISVSVLGGVPVLSRVVGRHPGTFFINSDQNHRRCSLRIQESETPSPNTRYGI